MALENFWLNIFADIITKRGGDTRNHKGEPKSSINTRKTKGGEAAGRRKARRMTGLGKRKYRTRAVSGHRGLGSLQDNTHYLAFIIVLQELGTRAERNLRGSIMNAGNGFQFLRHCRKTNRHRVK